MEKARIGENAGKVWHALNETGEITIHELSRKIHLSFEDTALAVGWLAREDKIFIQKKKDVLILSNENHVNPYFG